MRLMRLAGAQVRLVANMNTVCVMKELNGKKSYRWIPSTTLVCVIHTNELKNARYVKVGYELADCNRGNYLGVVVSKIKNDPDADTIGMDSIEMVEEIRRLREIVRKGNLK